MRRTRRNDRNAEIGFEQLHQIAFTCQFMRSLDIEFGAAQQFGDLTRVLAIGSRQQPLLPELFDLHDAAIGKPVLGIQALPAVVKPGDDAESKRTPAKAVSTARSTN